MRGKCCRASCALIRAHRCSRGFGPPRPWAAPHLQPSVPAARSGWRGAGSRLGAFSLRTARRASLWSGGLRKSFRDCCWGDFWRAVGPRDALSAGGAHPVGIARPKHTTIAICSATAAQTTHTQQQSEAGLDTLSALTVADSHSSYILRAALSGAGGAAQLPPAVRLHGR
jgi:hypothetical protein